MAEVQRDTADRVRIVERNIHFATLRPVEGAAYDSHDNEHNATCIKDTRRELLEEINHWADDPTTRDHIYWLQGKAGTGKSTIARTVAHDFATRDRLAASFFFRGTSPTAALPGASLRLLLPNSSKGCLRWLCMRETPLKPTLTSPQRRSESSSGSSSCNPVRAVPHGVSRTLTVVIDALDECKGEQDVTTIIKLLLQNDGPKTAPLKFFVTSRFEPPIRLGFQEGQGKLIEFPLHGIPQPIIERDIETFLRYRLEQTQRRFSLASSWPDPVKFQRPRADGHF